MNENMARGRGADPSDGVKWMTGMLVVAMVVFGASSRSSSEETVARTRTARRVPALAKDQALLAGGAGMVDPPIVRQPVSTFLELPASIRRALQSRGFAVPQPYGRRNANAVRGQFERRGQSDWAVLCSKDGVSRILIFWGGSTARVDSLAPDADEEFVQVVSPGRTGYSRTIAAIPPAAMRRFYEEWGGGRPPVPLTHDGIEDSFVEKASIVYYRHGGKWLRLAGAD